MSEPYGVLNAGEWSVRCRACPWRSRPQPVDPRTFRRVRQMVEAEWRAHPCKGTAANRLRVVGPPSLATCEVA
jgi:hypothetical protein